MGASTVVYNGFGLLNPLAVCPCLLIIYLFLFFEFWLCQPGLLDRLRIEGNRAVSLLLSPYAVLRCSVASLKMVGHDFAHTHFSGTAFRRPHATHFFFFFL